MYTTFSKNMCHIPILSLKFSFFVILNIQVSKCKITQPCLIHIEYRSENIPQGAKEVITQSLHLIGEVVNVKYEFDYSRFDFKGKGRCNKSIGIKDRNSNKASDLCRIIDIPGIRKDIESNSTGWERINLIVYVTSEPSHICHSSLAYASSCRYDESYVGGVRSCRPIIGVINICPEQLATNNNVDLRRIIIHEFIHLLGFSYSSIIEFLSCDISFQSNILCWKRKTVLTTSENDYLIMQSFDLIKKAMNLKANVHSPNIYNLDDNCNIRDEGKINDSLVKFCQSNCMFKTNTRIKDTLTDFESGIPVSSSKSGLHWPSNLFMDLASIMYSGNWTSGRIVILDPLTLTVLEDSGWYDINYGKVEMINCFINDISEGIGNFLKEPNDKNQSCLKNSKNYVRPVHMVTLNTSLTFLGNTSNTSIIERSDLNSSESISSLADHLCSQAFHVTICVIIMITIYVR